MKTPPPPHPPRDVPRGRLAPSPTGALHVGNLRTALCAWLAARSAGARLVMRVEDLDRGRVVPGAETRILATLRGLGLDWDEGPDVGGPDAPYRQSERFPRYRQMLETLEQGGWVYPCACTRAEVHAAASAPHAEAEQSELLYPGTCRDQPEDAVRARAAAAGRTVALRFRGGGTPIDFHDAMAGPQRIGCDDFVLCRSDGVASYQLAVVADDLAMRITQVVRGDDLLPSAARQIALYRALGAPPPDFAHVPLVLSPSGERLAKRHRPAPVDELLARGVPGTRLVGTLAASLGLCPPGEDVLPRDLVGGFSWARLRRETLVWTDDLLRVR